MAKKERPATMVVTSKECRFSYCKVFTPEEDDAGTPKYKTAILIKKSDKFTLDQVNAAVEAAKELGKAKWGGKIPPDAALKLPLRDGDAEKPDDEAYAGMMFFNASTTTKPAVVNSKLQEIGEDEFYSGCIGRASLNFYAYMAKGKKGVAVGLNNLQKWDDGERLAGGTSAADDFGDDSEADFDVDI